MDFSDVSVTSQFIRRGPDRDRAPRLPEPGAVRGAERRAVNQLGLTHLSFRVHGVAETVNRIVELGGAVVD